MGVNNTLCALQTRERELYPCFPRMPDRIVWVHVPKTGTTFGSRVLAQWGCNSDPAYPNNFTAALPEVLSARSGFLPEVARSKNLTEKCAQAYSFDGGNQWGHHPYTLNATLLYGQCSRLMAMVRDPISRVASGFADHLHSCPGVQRRLNLTEGKAPEFVHLPLHKLCADAEVVLAYARCVQGCTARMLTGRTCGRGEPRFWAASALARHGPSPLRSDRQLLRSARSWRDLSRAYRRMEVLDIADLAAVIRLVRTGSAFFGVTTEWKRSVCTFAALYPRRSKQPYDYAALMHNINPARRVSCSTKVAAVLRRANWRDPADEAIHAAAVARMDELYVKMKGCKGAMEIFNTCMAT